MTSHEAPGAQMLPGLRDAVEDARVRASRTRARRAAQWEPAATDPVARVLLDVPLAHLDRSFDYAIPQTADESVRAGVRVKVRFAGADVDGFVVGRSATSDHTGRLQPLRRVVSSEPVLAPEIVALCRALADRYAGTCADLLRLAVPPRHATTEKEPRRTPCPVPRTDGEPAAAWGHVPRGPAFLGHLEQGGGPRAVWSAAPGDDWPAMLASLVVATLRSGRGSLLCVPDTRDARRVSDALTVALGSEECHVVLSAESGPGRRYRDFLRVSRGEVRVVVGTRSAAFAPVADLGLLVVWDDGDDSHAEPRAPYPHVREVLLQRSEIQGAAVVLGGFARSVEAQHLVSSGWAHELVAPREVLRARARVAVVPAQDRSVATRLPGDALAVLREGLAGGPVLVQTPRAGYAPALSCERCRTPVRCHACAGPLAITGPTAPPSCRWCGRVDDQWRCPECGDHGLRAPVRGQARTAEELGRMLPGTTVRSSNGTRMLDQVPATPALVVATAGAEPVADGGYSAVVLLDTWLSLQREDLRVEEEALRRWMAAAGLVAPGGRVIAVGDPAQPALQALVRWDPGGFAEREAAARASAHLPPAARLATITGTPGALADALSVLAPPPSADVLGPVAVGDLHQVILRCPRVDGAALSAALLELQRLRSARKLEPIRVQVDPRSV